MKDSTPFFFMTVLRVFTHPVSTGAELVTSCSESIDNCKGLAIRSGDGVTDAIVIGIRGTLIRRCEPHKVRNANSDNKVRKKNVAPREFFLQLANFVPWCVPGKGM